MQHYFISIIALFLGCQRPDSPDRPSDLSEGVSGYLFEEILLAPGKGGKLAIAGVTVEVDPNSFEAETTVSLEGKQHGENQELEIGISQAFRVLVRQQGNTVTTESILLPLRFQVLLNESPSSLSGINVRLAEKPGQTDGSTRYLDPSELAIKKNSAGASLLYFSARTAIADIYVTRSTNNRSLNGRIGLSVQLEGETIPWQGTHASPGGATAFAPSVTLHHLSRPKNLPPGQFGGIVPVHGKPDQFLLAVTDPGEQKSTLQRLDAIRGKDGRILALHKPTQVAAAPTPFPANRFDGGLVQLPGKRYAAVLYSAGKLQFLDENFLLLDSPIDLPGTGGTFTTAIGSPGYELRHIAFCGTGDKCPTVKNRVYKLSLTESLSLTTEATDLVFPDVTEGMQFLKHGSKDVLLTSQWAKGQLTLFSLDQEKNPKIEESSLVATGISGAYGMTLDKVSGDILVTSWPPKAASGTAPPGELFVVRGLAQSVKGIGTPFDDVRVFWDANENGEHNAGESSAIPDSEGNFQLDGLDGATISIGVTTGKDWLLPADVSQPFQIDLRDKASDSLDINLVKKID